MSMHAVKVIVPEDSGICSICLEPMMSSMDSGIYILSCGHSFHSVCVQRWTLEGGGCPYCRAEPISMTCHVVLEAATYMMLSCGCQDIPPRHAKELIWGGDCCPKCLSLPTGVIVFLPIAEPKEEELGVLIEENIFPTSTWIMACVRSYVSICCVTLMSFRNKAVNIVDELTANPWASASRDGMAELIVLETASSNAGDRQRFEL